MKFFFEFNKFKFFQTEHKRKMSCSGSGSFRKNHNKGLGDSSGMGICNTYTEDGRCVSLLKILFTNVCIYDCCYCVSRNSNDIKRASFKIITGKYRLPKEEYRIFMFADLKGSTTIAETIGDVKYHLLLKL